MGRSIGSSDTAVSQGGPLPAHIRRVLIVGAGGFGREVYRWACGAWPADIGRLTGFLSADPAMLAGHDCPIPILANPLAFQPTPDTAFLLAIGIPRVRRTVAEALCSRGAEFLSLVHPTAIVSPTAVIGPGSIICPLSVVSDNARLGRFTLVNYHSSLAHDAVAGDFAVVSPYAALAGGAEIGDDVFLGLHASVGPGKRIGPRSKVSANSAALCDAPADSLVYGVPGRVHPIVSGAEC